MRRLSRSPRAPPAASCRYAWIASSAGAAARSGRPAVTTRVNTSNNNGRERTVEGHFRATRDRRQRGGAGLRQPPPPSTAVCGSAVATGRPGRECVQFTGDVNRFVPGDNGVLTGADGVVGGGDELGSNGALSRRKARSSWVSANCRWIERLVREGHRREPSISTARRMASIASLRRPVCKFGGALPEVRGRVLRSRVVVGDRADRRTTLGAVVRPAVPLPAAHHCTSTAPSVATKQMSIRSLRPETARSMASPRAQPRRGDGELRVVDPVASRSRRPTTGSSPRRRGRSRRHPGGPWSGPRRPARSPGPAGPPARSRRESGRPSPAVPGPPPLRHDRPVGADPEHVDLLREAREGHYRRPEPCRSGRGDREGRVLGPAARRVDAVPPLGVDRTVPRRSRTGRHVAPVG